MKPKSEITVWAVLGSEGMLVPFGNGKQFQYPIFHSKKEAMEWRNDDKLSSRGKIMKVKVKI